MLQAVVNHLSTNLAEWLIYGAIAIVTLIGFTSCILPVMKNSSGLNKATVKLENGIVSGSTSVWMDENFLGKSLRNEWHEFLSNAGQLRKRGVGCDTRDYVNEDSVIDKPGHAQLADLIPGLLTSLGILGTFVGLIMGLSGVDFSSASGTMDSIRTLLSGMKTAFYTSVVGISCSLVFNMVNRIVIGKALRALDNFDDSFSELVMPRPLQADVAMLCEKKDEDSRFSKLFSALSNQMAVTIESSVGRAMNPLTQSMDAFIQGATQEQVDGIRRVAGQFVFQMNNTLSDQFKQLGDTLQQVNQSQLIAQENMSATISSIEAMNKQAEQIASACQETVTMLQSFNQNVKQQQTDQSLNMESYQFTANELTEKLKGLTESIACMQNAVDQVTDSLKVEEAFKGGSMK